jgi:hypothetical protein
MDWGVQAAELRSGVPVQLHQNSLVGAILASMPKATRDNTSGTFSFMFEA